MSTLPPLRSQADILADSRIAGAAPAERSHGESVLIPWELSEWPKAVSGKGVSRRIAQGEHRPPRSIENRGRLKESFTLNFGRGNGRCGRCPHDLGCLAQGPHIPSCEANA